VLACALLGMCMLLMLVLVPLLSYYVATCEQSGGRLSSVCVSEFSAPSAEDLANMRVKLRERVLRDNSLSAVGGIYLEGGAESALFFSDTELPFYQESNFFYLTGIAQPNYRLLMDLASDQVILFAPNLADDYAVWNGEVLSLEGIRDHTLVDAVYYDEQFNSVLANLSASADTQYTLYTMPNVNVHLNATLLPRVQLEQRDLLVLMYARRSVKIDEEIALLRIASQVSRCVVWRRWRWESACVSVNVCEGACVYVCGFPFLSNATRSLLLTHAYRPRTHNATTTHTTIKQHHTHTYTHIHTHTYTHKQHTYIITPLSVTHIDG
jgi:Aminopeptidase P, N-terminal domain